MRFYRHGQAAERIQADLGVIETEFRRIKSRAKASFTAHVQQRIEPRTVTRTRTAKRGRSGLGGSMLQPQENSLYRFAAPFTPIG
jgi:hypothetical protein